MGANNEPETTQDKFEMSTAVFQCINQYPAYSVADHYSFQIFGVMLIVIDTVFDVVVVGAVAQLEEGSYIK